MGRRKFSAEFKQEAVRLVTEGGARQSEVARDLDLRPEQLRRWAKQYQQDPSGSLPGNGKPRNGELVRLQREIRRVKEERDILKKALAIFSERPR